MRTFVVAFALLAVVMSANVQVMSIIESELTGHYENPFANGSTAACRADELAGYVQGVAGWMCCPMAANSLCPTDFPAGNTAVPTPLLQDSQGNIRCGLVCSGSSTGICAPGAVCLVLPFLNGRLGDGNHGVCMYPPTE